MDNICAKDGCNKPIYTKNALIINSSIGTVNVYLCLNHLSEAINANIAKQSRDYEQALSKGKEQDERTERTEKD